METPTVEELKLREARVQGAEQAIRALKEATLALERRAAEFDADIRRIESRQSGNLKWTIGVILGFGAILTAAGAILLFDQADARRSLDAHITAEVTSTRQQIDAIEREVAALTQELRTVSRDTGEGRAAAEGLSQAVATLRQDIDDTMHRTDILLGRLSANVDNIRADFAFLVDGGGQRSSFEGQVYIDVPYESTDAGPTGTFLSDIKVSVLSSSGQLRAGTLRITVPSHGRIPRQAVTYGLNMQFLAALADRTESATLEDLRGIPSVDVLMTRFYELDAWPALIQASVDNQLTDFVIDRQPVGAH